MQATRYHNQGNSGAVAGLYLSSYLITPMARGEPSLGWHKVQYLAAILSQHRQLWSG